MALCEALLRCYPRRTRAMFRDELADVYEAMLCEAHASGGGRAVTALWPRLLLDLGAALTAEYLDAWREARLPPTAFAYAGLSLAVAAWMLMLVASLGDARWAAAVLEFNLALTMVLAFGLPVAALLALRLEARLVTAGQAVVARLGTGATIAGWTLLACHVA